MKFKKYLTEMLKESQLTEINKLIQENCKPYLRLIKGKYPLYRGMNYKNAKWGDIWTGEMNVRTNRKPRSHIKISMFKIINKWLEKHKHNRRDNAVMCISDKTRVSSFGNAYNIFPVGKMSYTWIESRDFNVDNYDNGWESSMYRYISFIQAGQEAEDRYNNDYRLRMSKPVLEYFHTDTDFDVAYKNGYEIWIKCKSYYYINAQTIELEWDKNKQLFF
jgi:hypothetical protein